MIATFDAHIMMQNHLLGAADPAEDNGTPPPDPAETITTELEEHVPDSVADMVAEAGPFVGVLIGAALALILGLIMVFVTSIVLKQIFRRKPQVKRAINRTRMPLFCIVLFAGTALSVNFAVASIHWWQGPLYVALIVAVIISVAWWALRVVKIVEAVILSRYSEGDVVDDRRGRRVQTQVNLIGRVLAAVIITLAVAAVLLLNENVRGLGAGLLASAGVVSVVAGLAMQTTLSNVFAGIQLAFTDAIRVGDVVIIEENYGKVEEITLTTVVIKAWNDLHFIYPSSHFVATPFQNWTRSSSEQMGVVELDVDWRVPMDALRARLQRVLESTSLWDGREGSIQVVDAVEGHLRVWVVVSTGNAGAMWDLRCMVREDLVNYIRHEHPYAVMTQRMLLSNEEALASRPDPVPTGQFGVVDPGSPAANSEGAATLAWDENQMPREEGLFTGSIAAVERNRDFSGPGDDAYEQRRDRLEDE